MARTRQEVRDFLNSQVGQKVNAKAGIYNGQCVSLIKALLEFLGVPNPYAARGNAISVNDTLLREGLAAPGGGWLTIIVNRDMGRIYENGRWNNYGHIWIDLNNEANFEQNGARALITTKNTRPRSQGQQEVNLDRYIKKEEVNMPTLIDEEGVRILAVTSLERPEPLTTTPDLKSHIGGDALAKIKEFWYSPEGEAANALRKKWRADSERLPAVESELTAVKQTTEKVTAELQAANDTVAAKEAENSELKAKVEALEKQAAEDTKAGDTFLRRIGQFFEKYWTTK